MTKTAIQKAEKKEVSAPADFGEFAGAGLEDISSNDMLVPRLGILQSLSPQLKKNDAARIEGAEQGHIADLGTGEIFPNGVLFLPVHYRKDWLEWAPRSSGKGLVNIHHDASILDQTTRDEKNRPILPNGNYLAETAQFFGMNLSAGGRLCFIPMASTQLKKARKWITLAMGEKLQRADGTEYTAPLFYRVYSLGTAEESNAEGSWYGWTVNRGPSLDTAELDRPWRSILADAIKFRASLVEGEVRGDVASMGADNDVVDAEVM